MLWADRNTFTTRTAGVPEPGRTRQEADVSRSRPDWSHARAAHAAPLSVETQRTTNKFYDG